MSADLRSRADPSNKTAISFLQDDFLQQNGLSTYDRMCPIYKTTGMAKNYVTFYNAALRAVENGLTWSRIKEGGSDIMFRLSQQKFEVSRRIWRSRFVSRWRG